MPAPHPPEFRRRAVELAREGAKPVAELAKDLGISQNRQLEMENEIRWIQLVVATPLIVEVLMGRPAGWMKALTGRLPMKSPGAPALRREVERAFWREVAEGVTAEEAAVAVGVSPAGSLGG